MQFAISHRMPLRSCSLSDLHSLGRKARVGRPPLDLIGKLRPLELLAIVQLQSFCVFYDIRGSSSLVSLEAVPLIDELGTIFGQKKISSDFVTSYRISNYFFSTQTASIYDLLYMNCYFPSPRKPFLVYFHCFLIDLPLMLVIRTHFFFHFYLKAFKGYFGWAIWIKRTETLSNE